MEHGWLKYYLDEEGETCFTVIDYIENVQEYKSFKFVYHNDKLISLEFLNNVKFTRNTSADHLEFIRKVNLLEIHDIPIVYTERVRLYYCEHTGVYGYIEYKLNDDTHWTKRATI